MVQKRKVGGRVTPSKKQRAAAEAERLRAMSSASPTPAPARTRGRAGEDRPRSSSRYTPPGASFRLRPRWHRVAGWAGVALGLIVVVVNDAMVFMDGVTILPFGHQELYLMLGMAVAIAATWFLGLFDRGTTVYD